MDISPAGLEQVQQGADGLMRVVDADVGGVVRDLQRLDPHLRVRFAEDGRPPFFAVYWESDDGRDTYLVTTAKAYLNASGVWEGLDQRLVRRLERIDGHGRSGYDYAAELRRQDERTRKAKRDAFAERMGEAGELAAAAVRKDLGVQHRVFVP